MAIVRTGNSKYPWTCTVCNQLFTDEHSAKAHRKELTDRIAKLRKHLTLALRHTDALLKHQRSGLTHCHICHGWYPKFTHHDCPKAEEIAQEIGVLRAEAAE
jgi:hypothetical protein